MKKEYKPVEGCDDCDFWTDTYGEPTICVECYADQELEDKVRLNEDTIHDSKHRFQQVVTMDILWDMVPLILVLLFIQHKVGRPTPMQVQGR